MNQNGNSPAGMVMDEAIELAIAGDSPYPEAAWFLNADWPSTERVMKTAFEEGLPVVLVAADGSTRTVWPEEAS
jgi:hypothetical protein